MPEHKAALGHESPVESVAFDGNILVTGSQDGRVRQWEITAETAPTSASQGSEAPGDSESQPDGITASTTAPLTETTLDESVVTLTLNGGTYERSSSRIRNAVTVSTGITGVTVRSFDIDRGRRRNSKLQWLRIHRTDTRHLGFGAIGSFNYRPVNRSDAGWKHRNPHTQWQGL